MMKTNLNRTIPVELSGLNSHPELNKYIVINYYAAIDRYGEAGLLPFLADDFRASMTGVPGTLDRQGYSEVIGGLYEGISGFTHEVLDISAEGESVHVETLSGGLHSGLLMGLPASGKQVRVPGRSVFTLRNNKIVEAIIEFDLALLLEQVGAAPVMEPAYA